MSHRAVLATAAVLLTSLARTSTTSAFSVSANQTEHGLVQEVHAHGSSRHLAANLSAGDAAHDAASCLHTVFMCKQPSSEQVCPHVKPACVRPLFVTGTGFSGTKAAVEIMRYTLPTTVVHEDPWSSAQVEVSWCTRCDANSRAFYNGPSNPLPPPAKPGRGRKRKTFAHFGTRALDMSDQCLAQHVVHLVRHPLKFIASALKYATPGVQRETRKPNAAVWATIVDFTPKADPKVMHIRRFLSLPSHPPCSRTTAQPPTHQTHPPFLEPVER